MKYKIYSFLLLIFIFQNSFLFASNIQEIENQDIFSELHQNRILFKLIQGNLNKLNTDPDLYELNNQTKCDSARVKWEYLGPFIGGVVVTNALIYYIFKDAYWKEERTKFHTFNDWNNADMNIDKLGHFYAGMLLSKASYKILRLTNVPEKKSIIYSILSSIFFQTQIVIHDAFYKKWGWSWWDFGGNVFGAIYPLLQTYIKPLIKYKSEMELS